MKKTMLFAVALMTCDGYAGAAVGDELTDGTFNYRVLSEDEKTVAILGCDNLITSNIERLVIPNEVDGYTVTEIADSAFYAEGPIYGSLRKVTCNADLKKIGYRAFFNGLLNEVTFNQSLESIGDEAFKFNRITAVNLPAGLRQLGHNVFCNVTGGDGNGIYSVDGVAYLAKIEVDEANPELLAVDNILYRRVGDEELEVVLCPEAMSGDVTLQPSTTSVAPYAFSGCKNITSLTLPDGCKSLGEKAFVNCASIESLGLGRSLESIAVKALEGCVKLKNVKLPATVSEVARDFSSGCNMLDSITVEKGARWYSSYDGVLYSINDDETVTLQRFPNHRMWLSYADNVTEIAPEAFKGCRYLREIDLPSTVTKIGEGAFCDCSYVSSIYVAGPVEVIEDRTFYKSMSIVAIKTIYLPGTVRSIGQNVISSSSSDLQSIVFDGVEPPAICANSFPEFTACDLYLPSTADVALWESWKDKFTIHLMEAVSLAMDNEMTVETDECKELLFELDSYVEVTGVSVGDEEIAEIAELVKPDDSGRGCIKVKGVTPGVTDVNLVCTDRYGVRHFLSCEVTVTPSAGIESVGVDFDDAREDGQLYDLMGRKVTNPVPGIYVRGGRKVVIN